MYKLPKEIRDAIVAYLQLQPYKEVAQGINMLMTLEEINEEKTKESPKKD